MQAGDNALREEINSLRSDIAGFKNNMIFLILGAWFTLMAGIAGLFVTQFT